MGWQLFNDFLHVRSGRYRSRSESYLEEPFTQNALESGRVLSDFLIEHGERLAGLHVNSFIDLYYDGHAGETAFRNMFGRMLRALQRIEIKKQGEARPLKEERWSLKVDDRGRRLIWISDSKSFLEQSAIVYDDLHVAYDWPERLPAYVKRRVRVLARKTFGEP